MALPRRRQLNPRRVVDTFGGRRRGEGPQLTAIANLSGLSSSLQRFMAAESEITLQERDQEAAELFARLQDENADGWAKAIAQRSADPALSPWTQLGLRERLADALAKQYDRDLQAALVQANDRLYQYDPETGLQANKPDPQEIRRSTWEQLINRTGEYRQNLNSVFAQDRIRELVGQAQERFDAGFLRATTEADAFHNQRLATSEVTEQATALANHFAVNGSLHPEAMEHFTATINETLRRRSVREPQKVTIGALAAAAAAASEQFDDPEVAEEFFAEMAEQQIGPAKLATNPEFLRAYARFSARAEGESRARRREKVADKLDALFVAEILPGLREAVEAGNVGEWAAEQEATAGSRFESPEMARAFVSLVRSEADRAIGIAARDDNERIKDASQKAQQLLTQANRSILVDGDSDEAEELLSQALSTGQLSSEQYRNALSTITRMREMTGPREALRTNLDKMTADLSRRLGEFPSAERGAIEAQIQRYRDDLTAFAESGMTADGELGLVEQTELARQIEDRARDLVTRGKQDFEEERNLRRSVIAEVEELAYTGELTAERARDLARSGRLSPEEASKYESLAAKVRGHLTGLGRTGESGTLLNGVMRKLSEIERLRLSDAGGDGTITQGTLQSFRRFEQEAVKRMQETYRETLDATKSPADAYSAALSELFSLEAEAYEEGINAITTGEDSTTARTIAARVAPSSTSGDLLTQVQQGAALDEEYLNQNRTRLFQGELGETPGGIAGLVTFGGRLVPSAATEVISAQNKVVRGDASASAELLAQYGRMADEVARRQGDDAETMRGAYLESFGTVAAMSELMKGRVVGRFPGVAEPTTEEMFTEQPRPFTDGFPITPAKLREERVNPAKTRLFHSTRDMKAWFIWLTDVASEAEQKKALDILGAMYNHQGEEPILDLSGPVEDTAVYKDFVLNQTRLIQFQGGR